MSHKADIIGDAHAGIMARMGKLSSSSGDDTSNRALYPASCPQRLMQSYISGMTFTPRWATQIMGMQSHDAWIITCVPLVTLLHNS